MPPKEDSQIANAKRKPGRPAFAFTESVIKQIEEMAGGGLTLRQVAACLGVGESTLYREQRSDGEVLAAMERGRAKVARSVANALVRKADKGDIAAIRWYEATRQGRSEKTVVNNDETSEIDVSRLTPEQAETLRSLLSLAREQDPTE